MTATGISSNNIESGTIEDLRREMTETTELSRCLENKMESLSSHLLQTGQQIPAHGQSDLSSTQKEYLKTASELLIIREKKLVLQTNLEVQCS